MTEAHGSDDWTVEDQNKAMKNFIRKVLWGYDDWCTDVDGGDLQDWAEDFELIRLELIPEPCCENCACAELTHPDDFPVECYRYAEWLKPAS